MTRILFLFTLIACVSAAAEERKLKDRSERGTLADRFEKIRGDSGKWRDEPRLQVSPNIHPVAGKSLDVWADAMNEKSWFLTDESDTWLIYRSEQLDDNDRLWIESITREGNTITVTFCQATWLGYYSKNFTWYGAWAVNLGKLEAGKYKVEWEPKQLEFQQFEDPKNRRNSWPKDEKPIDDKTERWFYTEFRVSG